MQPSQKRATVAGVRLFSSSVSTSKKFGKVMAANRGEIAVRILRAATELDKVSTGIYSNEDRYSPHRYKADESYLVGEGLSPVMAYLNYDGIIEVAKAHGVDAIHPGYGFLSENPEFADACAKAGIKFVGPSGDVIRKFGSKTEARALAMSAGVPVVPGSDGAVTSVEDAKAFATEAGLPIIIKAAYGGGGRGMRIVRTMDELEEAFDRARSEAASAFGNDTVFMEKFVEHPRHIEVQVLADSYGNVIHLYERDCSVQRRHQKVVEMAPAMWLDPELRQTMLDDSIKLAKAVNYENAGTVEFLVDTETGKHYFMEVNPRVQVEHTVTEEVTGVDIVQSQIRIAEGASLADLGLSQEAVSTSGYAIQCRITTEDPATGFQPDTGVITVYRSGAGPGVRLDGGPGYPGANISPYYDSLLVKVTARSGTFEGAVAKLTRALKEHRIRGVTTNIHFLANVLQHKDFLSGAVTTRFIEEHPEVITEVEPRLDRGTKLLRYLADVTVNGLPPELGATPGVRPSPVDPPIPDPDNLSRTPGAPAPVASLRSVYTDIDATPGSGTPVRRDPEAFARAVREHKGLLLTDTTWRDAHQSLLATRVRTIDLLNIAPATRVALANLYSIENWGGATFDVCMRFLRECPWERLAAMREAIPDIPFQMLLRGANAVGYTSYPDNAVHKFCQLAVDNGMDVFRVFDSLNYLDNMKLGIDAVGSAGGIVEASVCYTGDITDPSRTKYTLEYYLEFARALVEAGAHVLAIKDMAGLLKPEAATILVSALRAEFPDIPIHVHTHDTPGTGVASMIAAAHAGADAVDCAVDSMSGTTSQPSMGALVGALAGSPLDTGLDLRSVGDINNYWEETRGLYAPFEAGQHTGSADTYLHEMPGGQYTNLLFQSKQLGLTGRWALIKQRYADANDILGDIVKVTPSSKVVGDLAQFMVANELTKEEVLAQAGTLSFPASVVEYLQGYLGIPPGGFPEPFRTHVLADRRLPDGSMSFSARPGIDLPPTDFDAVAKDLEADFGPGLADTDLASYVMYPQVFKDWKEFQRSNGQVSHIPTRQFLQSLSVGEEFSMDVAPGKTLYVKLDHLGPVDQSGFRNVTFIMNGEHRTIRVEDKQFAGAVDAVSRPKAVKTDSKQVGAPMMGVVIDVKVEEGDEVVKGQPLLVMSAMKMETVVAAAEDGVVKTITAGVNDNVEAGDLLVQLE